MRPSAVHSFTRTSESSRTARRTRSPMRATASGSPATRASVTAGSTNPLALVTVASRTASTASRSPTRRLAINVPTPTMSRAKAPAAANCPTWRATTRRGRAASLPRDRYPGSEGIWPLRAALWRSSSALSSPPRTIASPVRYSQNSRTTTPASDP